MDDLQAHKERIRFKKMLLDKKWRLGRLSTGAEVVINVYAYDPFISGDSAVAGLTAENITMMKSVKELMDIITGAVGHQFKRYIEATDKQRDLRAEELGVVMGLYMVNTESYLSLCKNKTLGNRHFIILLYRNKFSGLTSLRPFGIVSEKQALSVSDLQELSRSVIEHDEVRNPGFFNSNSVTPIR